MSSRWESPTRPLASRSFYSDRLGWTRSFEVEGDVVFYQSVRGLLLSLFGLSDLDDDVLPPRLSTAFSLGAVMLKQAQPASWGGHHGNFDDRDGHRWEVAYNAGALLNDDGSLTITPTA
jgi:uncharacterized protein